MTGTSLLLAAALGLVAAPSAAVSAAQTGKSTICHRTGQPSQGGLFTGIVLNVSTQGAADHVDNHNDVLAGAVAAKKLRQSGGCFTDAKGALYDGARVMVQRAPGDVEPAPPPPPPPGPPPGGGPG